MDHGVRTGEIQAGAAGFERNQEDVDPASVIEGIHHFNPVCSGCSPAEEIGGDVESVQQPSDRLQRFDKLGEDQNPVTFLQVFRNQFGEHLQLSASSAVVLYKHARIDTDLAEPGEIGQNIKSLPALFQLLPGLLAHGLIEPALPVRHVRGKDPVISGGKILQHIPFYPAENKRSGLAGNGGGIAVPEL